MCLCHQFPEAGVGAFSSISPLFKGSSSPAQVRLLPQSGDLNSSPYICAANTLPTEPSSLPLFNAARAPGPQR